MTPPMPPPPPAGHQVDPRVLRPRRFWYVVGPTVFVLCCLVAVGLFVWTLYRTGSGFQVLGPERTTLQLSPDEDKTLYASVPPPGEPVAAASDGPCQAQGPGKVRLQPVTGSVTLTRGDTTWYGVAHVHVTEPGDYAVSCTSPTDVRFAIGSKFTVFGLVGSIFGLFILPLIGFLIGGAIVLVTALRRNSHKKRLLTQAAGPPPPGPGGPYAPGPGGPWPTSPHPGGPAPGPPPHGR